MSQRTDTRTSRSRSSSLSWAWSSGGISAMVDKGASKRTRGGDGQAKEKRKHEVDLLCHSLIPANGR